MEKINGVPLIYGLKVDIDNSPYFSHRDKDLVYTNNIRTIPSYFSFFKIDELKSGYYQYTNECMVTGNDIIGTYWLEPKYTVKMVKGITKGNKAFFVLIVFKHDNGLKTLDTVIMDSEDAKNIDRSRIKYLFDDYGTIALYEEEYGDMEYIKRSFSSIAHYSNYDEMSDFINNANLCVIDNPKPFSTAKTLNRFVLFNDGVFDYIINNIDTRSLMVDVIRVDGIIPSKMYLSDIKFGNFNTFEDYRTVEFYEALDGNGKDIVVAYDYENVVGSNEKFIRDVYCIDVCTGDIKINCSDDVWFVHDKIATIPLSDTNICRNTALIAYLCSKYRSISSKILELYAMYEHIEEKKYRDGR